MQHGEAVSITTYDAAVGVLWRSDRHCQRPLKDENALNFYNLFATVGVNSFVFFLLFIFVWVAINKQNGIIYIYITFTISTNATLKWFYWARICIIRSYE